MIDIFQYSNVQTAVIYKSKYIIYSFSQRLNIQYNLQSLFAYQLKPLKFCYSQLLNYGMDLFMIDIFGKLMIWH
jgi:hypothetical protein